MSNFGAFNNSDLSRRTFVSGYDALSNPNLHFLFQEENCSSKRILDLHGLGLITGLEALHMGIVGLS